MMYSKEHTNYYGLWATLSSAYSWYVQSRSSEYT